MLTYISIIAAVTWCLQTYLLDPLQLQFLQTILFILVIAALVQMLEIIIRKIAPALYEALGVFLPLITTNCAVLGVAILVIQKQFTLLESVVYGFATSLGFTLALWIFAGIREQLAVTKVRCICIFAEYVSYSCRFILFSSLP